MSFLNKLFSKKHKPEPFDANACDSLGITLLMRAANCSYIGRTSGEVKGEGDRVQHLIASGANVNAKSKYGTTALMLASGAGSVVNVKALIAAGADVNAKDIHGCMPLHFANSPDVASVLLNAGAYDCDCSDDCRNHKWSVIVNKRK
jgi:ankyrin repeat protein